MGALMLEDGDDRAVLALENARTLNPQDKIMWRMLGFAYARAGREREATGAASVGLVSTRPLTWIALSKAITCCMRGSLSAALIRTNASTLLDDAPNMRPNAAAGLANEVDAVNQ